MRKITLMLFCIFCLGVFGANAGYANVEEFSADMVSRAQGRAMQVKIYVSGEKMRTEAEGSIIISRLDKNISWVIMPSEKMYMEQAIDRKAMPKTSKGMDGETERVLLGKETVSGKSCEKFKVTYTENNVRVSAYQWLTDSGFPIKMEAEDGSWSMEYRNFSEGPQPQSLFELPSGYQKLSMPSMDDIMSQVRK